MTRSLLEYFPEVLGSKARQIILGSQEGNARYRDWNDWNGWNVWNQTASRLYVLLDPLQAGREEQLFGRRLFLDHPLLVLIAYDRF